MARYFRASPLNAIWEGSGNVIALDILRAIGREPETFEAVAAEIARAGGANPHFDQHARALSDWLKPGALNEANARAFAEAMGATIAAAALKDTAPDHVFDAFCNARLDPAARADHYGATSALMDEAAIIARAAPF